MTVKAGQIVDYTFRPDEPLGGNKEAGQTQTVPAIVVEVFDETCVNLRVFQDGSHPPLWCTSIPRKDVAGEVSDYWQFQGSSD